MLCRFPFPTSQVTKTVLVNPTSLHSALTPLLPKMKLIPQLTALLAATAFSHPTTQSRISKTEPTTSVYCVPIVPRRYISATILPRMQGPRPDEVSLSPPALNGPGPSTSNNITKTNISTSRSLHTLPSPPTWVVTVEDLITAIFRIVMTVLALFNVNITWRIRGECHGSLVCP